MAKVRINGDTSGYIELASPAAAGSNTITLPSSNGSANQLLKNSGTAGTLAWSILTEDSSGNLNIDSGTLYVDASNNRVGIGTTAPLASIEITGSSECMRIQSTTAANNYITHKHNSSGDIAYIGAAGGGALTSGANTDYAIRANQGALLFGTNGNNERARIDSSGRFLVGTSSARSNLYNSTFTSPFQVEGTSYNTTGGLFVCNANDATTVSILNLAKTRGTSAGSNTVVQSGDLLGVVDFLGSDGSELVEAAFIGAYVDGTPGSNDMPGRLVFSTTADGASSPTERVRIDSSGRFLAGTTSTTSIAGVASIHRIVGSGSGSWATIIENSTATPYGLCLFHSGTSPNSTSNQFLYCLDASTLRAEIRSNGGIANFSANNVNLSDRNVKKDISPAAGTWGCLKEWEIVNFRYKDQPDDSDLNMGVIAQQVAESCPEVITVFQEAREAKEAVLDEDGNELEPAQEAQPEKLGVKDQQMMWMAIKALQEAQLRIEQLETLNASFEARLAALEVKP